MEKEKAQAAEQAKVSEVQFFKSVFSFLSIYFILLYLFIYSIIDLFFKLTVKLLSL